MRCTPLARPLALLALVLPAIGMVLVLQSGSLLGLALIASGIPLGFSGWLALGRPVRRTRQA
jgi:hypothetical protein